MRKKTCFFRIASLLPPVRHVVRGPPALEEEVLLELAANAGLKLGGKFLHPSVVLVVEEGTDTAQVLQ